jgi:hypothetical protein
VTAFRSEFKIRERGGGEEEDGGLYQLLVEAFIAK